MLNSSGDIFGDKLFEHHFLIYIKEWSALDSIGCMRKLWIVCEFYNSLAVSLSIVTGCFAVVDCDDDSNAVNVVMIVVMELMSELYWWEML